MPICELDPWRMQYFEKANCPNEVNIPTEDADAYIWNPDYRWVYNKLMVSESQGLSCAPHGVDPTEFPVFSKPIMNMRGMGMGSKLHKNYNEYLKQRRPGHMWMQYLTGDHISTDIAVLKGKPVWWKHAQGIPIPKGMFDYWIIETKLRENLVEYCEKWINQHLNNYTGMLNLETIGEKIIEVHLRFSDQWPDLYGKNWVDALINLYANHEWTFQDSEPQDTYSVVLFGAHGVQYSHPAPEILSSILDQPAVSSVQITFYEDIDPKLHAMPPGGFRLAIINGYDLEALKKIRQELALSFWTTQKLLSRKKNSPHLNKKGLQANSPSDSF